MPFNAAGPGRALARPSWPQSRSIRAIQHSMPSFALMRHPICLHAACADGASGMLGAGTQPALQSLLDGPPAGTAVLNFTKQASCKQPGLALYLLLPPGVLAALSQTNPIPVAPPLVPPLRPRPSHQP